MYSIVSLLDEQHHEIVQDLWDEFKARFGVHGVHLTPVPHFTYHGAEGYDFNRLQATLEEIAAGFDPFQIKTAGLGIFTGPDLVLHIPVIRDPHLNTVQSKIWAAVEAIADQPGQHYHPNNWHAHITLTHHDVGHELLPEIIRLLSQRDFTWAVNITDLALLGSEGDTPHVIRLRAPLNSAR